MNFRQLTGKIHLWLGLASGLVIFIVCLTGSIYTFRAQIENALNYKKVHVESRNAPFISLDTIHQKLEKSGIKVAQIILYGKPGRSHEVLFASGNGKESGTYFLSPYTGEITGTRNTALSPFFEFILRLHKSLLLSNPGKQIVAASVLIFVFMLLSGIVLWMPRKLRNITGALKISWSKVKPPKLIDLHKVPGIYALLALLLIAIMGLYISYPWVKSAVIVSFGGNPVLSKATEKQKEKIKGELAGSFSASLQKIIANKNSPSGSDTGIYLQRIVNCTDSILPYKGIITITLPGKENSWVKVRKINRENMLRALLPDELEFNKSGKPGQKKLFAEKSPDQKLVAIALPLHTGEILGWPGLILYFIISLIGASLPVTGTLMWYKRKKAQIAFRKGMKSTENSSTPIKTDSEDWLIAYATKSGNSKLIALMLQEQFRKTGMEIRCMNASNVELALLEKTTYLFMVISTDGDGVPPPSARKLFNQLAEAPSPLLSDLHYSICALGDSAYEAYCKAGKDLEKLLKQNHAKAFMSRVDCDADFALPSSNWMKACINKALLKYGINDTTVDLEINAQNIACNSEEEIRVSEIKRLTRGATPKPCFHISFISEKKLSIIRPGDSIEIHPNNPDWLVGDICSRLNIPHTNRARGQLAAEYEITSLTKATIERYQVFAKNNDIQELLNNQTELRRYLARANFYDLLADFPVSVGFESLKKILPKKKGRLYSVASSTCLYPNELHLTVKTIRYDYKSRKHEGAGSVELTNHLRQGDILRYKHYPNLEFRLPEDETAPLILIGVGTGIAPFRAFLQENQFLGAKREIWLIWGDKYKDNDFLYKKELLDFKANKTLKKLDVAFSRDGKEKIYVQNLLENNQQEFLIWLEKRAHVYVCGSLNMAENVKSVIARMLNRHADPKLVFDELSRQQRYHEDAY